MLSKKASTLLGRGWGDVDTAEYAPQGPFSSFQRQCTITLAAVGMVIAYLNRSHQLNEPLVRTATALIWAP